MRPLTQLSARGAALYLEQRSRAHGPTAPASAAVPAPLTLGSKQRQPRRWQPQVLPHQRRAQRVLLDRVQACGGLRLTLQGLDRARMVVLHVQRGRQYPRQQLRQGRE